MHVEILPLLLWTIFSFENHLLYPLNVEPHWLARMISLVDCPDVVEFHHAYGPAEILRAGTHIKLVTSDLVMRNMILIQTCIANSNADPELIADYNYELLLYEAQGQAYLWTHVMMRISHDEYVENAQKWGIDYEADELIYYSTPWMLRQESTTENLVFFY